MARICIGIALCLALAAPGAAQLAQARDVDASAPRDMLRKVLPVAAYCHVDDTVAALPAARCRELGGSLELYRAMESSDEVQRISDNGIVQEAYELGLEEALEERANADADSSFLWGAVLAESMDAEELNTRLKASGLKLRALHVHDGDAVVLFDASVARVSKMSAQPHELAPGVLNAAHIPFAGRIEALPETFFVDAPIDTEAAGTAKALQESSMGTVRPVFRGQRTTQEIDLDPPLEGYKLCAFWAQECVCTGMVIYGDFFSSRYTEPRFVDGSEFCLTNIFGEPAPGVRKYCFCMPMDEVEEVVEMAEVPVSLEVASAEPSAASTDAPLYADFEYCSHWRGTCSCKGLVVYGNRFIEAFSEVKYVNGDILCFKSSFDDFTNGKRNSCYCKPELDWAPSPAPTMEPSSAMVEMPSGEPTLVFSAEPSASPLASSLEGYSFCADQWTGCVCTGLVIYGDPLTDRFTDPLYVESRVGCITRKFGDDPADGVAKSCYCKPDDDGGRRVQALEGPLVPALLRGRSQLHAHHS